jgi:hypothetical protein
MSYSAITTCNAEQWARYGRAMVKTFQRFWPDQVPLTVYSEGFQPQVNGRVRHADLYGAAPWLEAWKEARTPAQRGMTPKGYRYRWDAARFSHKVAAIEAGASQTNTDVLIWMDADIVTHAPVTTAWLDSLLPVDSDLGWLDRENYYPECGFLMFRLPNCARVIRQIGKAYRSGDIFRLGQWHDSYVIETMVMAAVARGKIKVASLSGEGRTSHHPLVNSRLGECLDHLKGSRKARGRSAKHDLVKARSEPYWQ